MYRGVPPTYACAAIVDPVGRVLLVGERGHSRSDPATVEISKEVFVPKGLEADGELDSEFIRSLGVSLYRGGCFHYLDRHEEKLSLPMGQSRRVIMLTYTIIKKVDFEASTSMYDFVRFMTFGQIKDALVDDQIKFSTTGSKMVQRLYDLNKENKI